MLKSVCRVLPRCRSVLCQRAQCRTFSEDNKRTGFGDIMIEYEPYQEADGKKIRKITTMFGDIEVEVEPKPQTDDTEFSVPSYPARINESEEALRARLTYQSRKRGIAENCLILSTFFSEQGPNLPRKIVDQFDILINTVDSDWDLYYWMTGKDQPPPPYDNEVMKMLIEFTQNKEMKDRTQQPDL
ncbi:hypothetical protein ACHWQZ_G014939 [Mnemiopsis leidyi]